MFFPGVEVDEDVVEVGKDEGSEVRSEDVVDELHERGRSVAVSLLHDSRVEHSVDCL